MKTRKEEDMKKMKEEDMKKMKGEDMKKMKEEGHTAWQRRKQDKKREAGGHRTHFEEEDHKSY